MKTKLEINVTEGDIKRGESGKAYTCPIAKAANRAFGYKREVIVGPYDLEFNLGGKTIEINLPTRAQNFIDNFDSGIKVKPFKFILRYDK